MSDKSAFIQRQEYCLLNLEPKHSDKYFVILIFQRLLLQHRIFILLKDKCPNRECQSSKGVTDVAKTVEGEEVGRCKKMR